MSTSALSWRGEQTSFARESEARRSLARRLRSRTFLLGLFVLSACDASEHRMSTSPPVAAAQVSAASRKLEELRMWMTVGERRFAITLADNAAARAFAGMLP